MSVQVGDTLSYIPDTCHALTAGPAGYPWVVGVKEKTIDHSKRGASKEVVELTADQLSKRIKSIRKHPRAKEQMDKLVFIRPKTLWPAKVTAVNEDGTVNLDVAVGGGVTLHCDNIKECAKGTTPNCYKPATTTEN